MLAFHSDQKVKDKYLSRVLAHQKADRIIQGTGWEDGKGCAVGCTLENYSHSQYPIELGIPEWMARLEDSLFEGMKTADALLWPAKFLDAITPGQDLEKVKIPFLIFIVESAKEKFDHKKYPDCLKAINKVLKELKKDTIDLEKLKKARAAAAAYAAAYAAAAYAAAYAAADVAADAADAADVAYVAADAADAAADVADVADVAYVARRNEYKKFADKLLQLIRELV